MQRIDTSSIRGNQSGNLILRRRQRAEILDRREADEEIRKALRQESDSDIIDSFEDIDEVA